MFKRAMVLVAAMSLSSPLAATKPSPAKPDWLAGTGEQMGEEGRWAGEYWTPPRGDIMMGAARIGQRERLVAFEFNRIMRMEHGVLSLFAQPSGKPSVEFPMRRVGKNMIEFANAAHDYRQLINMPAKENRLRSRSA